MYVQGHMPLYICRGNLKKKSFRCKFSLLQYELPGLNLVHQESPFTTWVIYIVLKDLQLFSQDMWYQKMFIPKNKRAIA